jgi:glutaredoxin
MKGLLKKIALITLVLCLVVPFIPKAYAAVNLEDYTSTTLEDALKEEEIEYDFKHTYSDNHVKIYLFRGKGCGYCHKFLEFAANTLMKDYADKVDVVPYEVWYDEKNGELFQGVAEMLGQNAEGVPFIVIGQKSFGGYSEEMNSDITAAIDAEYSSSERYDALNEYVKYADNKEKEAKKANQVDLSSAIIWNFIFTTASTVIILAFVNKRYHDLKGDRKVEDEEYDDSSKEIKSNPTKKKSNKK